MRRTKETIPEQDNGTFNLSISDLMAGLLSIFILALCFYILNFTQKTSTLTENNIKREQLIKELQKEIESMGIKVTIDEKRGILRIPEDTLSFASASAVVPDEQKVIKIGNVLLQTLKKDNYKNKVETVFIEGHTDNIPISNYQFQSNWELSTQRAINVWNVMRKSPNDDLSKLTYVAKYRDKDGGLKEVEEPLFSCSGYAETRPVGPNNTDAERKINRRIDIRFTMVPPVEEDSSIVKTVKEKLQGE